MLEPIFNSVLVLFEHHLFRTETSEEVGNMQSVIQFPQYLELFQRWQGVLPRDQLSRNQLPLNQFPIDQLPTRSTPIKSTSHEINC